MPIYEYECSRCFNRFERRQSVTEQPVKTCPSCGAPVRRVYHPVGIVFKGSGFYCTDNRKSTTDSSSTVSTPSASSDAKPESKAEGKKEAATATSSTK